MFPRRLLSTLMGQGGEGERVPKGPAEGHLSTASAELTSLADVNPRSDLPANTRGRV
jgi:hypothetical protein